jgi:rfaE bifunctional protein kinase chain/domain
MPVSALAPFVDKMRGKRIAVVGDIMLDEYLRGSVERISPEAPVPVVNFRSREVRLGGAANVALNLAALDIEALIFGVSGADESAALLHDLLRLAEIENQGIIADNSRPTTRKTRILADNHHLTRIDHEDSSTIAADLAAQILAKLAEQCDSIDAIILQDYNKGVLSEALIRGIIAHALEAKCPVTVDPKRDNFFSFQGASVFKPNLREAETALGYSLRNDDALQRGGHELRQRLQCQAVLITRGSEGMSLFADSDLHVPTQARLVSEVSGAGDTVIATLTAAIAAGADLPDAARLANIAAGFVVEQVGIVPVSSSELRQRIASSDVD